VLWSAACWLLAGSLTSAQAGADPAATDPLRGEPTRAAAGQDAESDPPADEAQEDGDGEEAGPSPAELQAAALADALARLRQGEEPALALTVPAVDAVRAAAWPQLGELLDVGSASTRVAVLTALRNTQSDALLPRVQALAVDPAVDAEVRRAAGELLDTLAIASPEVFDGFLAALRTRELPEPQLARLIEALGGSRRLLAVEPLIAELDGPHAAVAKAALAELTVQQASTLPAGPVAWREWWSRNSWQTREQLLEAALASERDHAGEALRQRDALIVQLQLRLMGQDVARLVDALSLDYAAVRLEAARRLGRHANVEQAASAVPVLLARLGHPTQVDTSHANGGASTGATTNGSAGAKPAGDVGNASAAALETDPEVRRALVAALGVLGRDLPAVREALLLELRSDDLGTAAEAVNALARVRNAPDVVLPLLDLLGRPQLDPAAQATALTVVAQNRPLGVTARLLPWTTSERPAAVRAAGVRALLAGADPSEVLEQVETLVAGETSPDVRYAVAMGLGEQLRRLGRDVGSPEADARLEIVQVLGRLLDDVDPSVRAEAASSLGDSGQLGALGLLEARTRAEADASVMSRILDALGTLRVIDAVGTIGRVCAAWQGNGRDVLEAAARRAVETIGDDQSAADLLGMARTLQQVGAFPLAAWVLRDTLRRFEGDPAEHEVVGQARGELANVLWQAGQAEEAHALLVELHEAGAPHPIATTRLDLLARTSEQLTYFDQAAEYYAERLEILGEGDSTRDENRRSLARTLMLAGEAERALPLIIELLEEDGGDNALLESRARAEASSGRVAEARATYARLLERLPAEDVAARERVDAALQRLGEPTPLTPPDGAESDLESVVSDDSDAR